MEAGTAALLGALSGAVVTGGLTFLNTLASNRFQRGQAAAQREYQANEAKMQRENEAAENAVQREHEAAERRQRHAAELLPQRLDLITEWRKSLKDGSDAFENRDQSKHYDDQPELDLIGKPWFESLRAHLTDSDEARDLAMSATLYARSDEVWDIMEIASIENQWIEQALGNQTPRSQGTM